MLNHLEILFLAAALLLGLELDVGNLGGRLEGLLGLLGVAWCVSSVQPCLQSVLSLQME